MWQATGKGDTGVRAVHLTFDAMEAVAGEQSDIGSPNWRCGAVPQKAPCSVNCKRWWTEDLTQYPTNARYRLGVPAHLLGQTSSGRFDLQQAAEASI